MQTNELQKYSIRNFFMVRRFYNYVRPSILLVIGLFYIFRPTSPEWLIIPFLIILLSLCISVELAKIMYKYPYFIRKKSGNKRWIITEIIFNLFILIIICTGFLLIN